MDDKQSQPLSCYRKGCKNYEKKTCLMMMIATETYNICGLNERFKIKINLTNEIVSFPMWLGGWV